MMPIENNKIAFVSFFDIFKYETKDGYTVGRALDSILDVQEFLPKGATRYSRFVSIEIAPDFIIFLNAIGVFPSSIDPLSLSNMLYINKVFKNVNDDYVFIIPLIVHKMKNQDVFNIKRTQSIVIKSCESYVETDNLFKSVAHTYYKKIKHSYETTVRKSLENIALWTKD